MLSFLCDIASGFFGALIPIFYSYKALKKNTKISLVYWLKYWSMYGAFMACDLLLNTFYLTYLIPFYSVLKLIYVLWTVSPVTAGAQFMFDKVLSSFIRRHERRLEKYVNRLVIRSSEVGPAICHQVASSVFGTASGIANQLTFGGRPEMPVLVRSIEHQPENDFHQNDEVDQHEPEHRVPEIKPDLSRVKVEPEDDEIVFVGQYSAAAMVVETRGNEERPDNERAEDSDEAATERLNLSDYMNFSLNATENAGDEHEEQKHKVLNASPVRRSARLRSRAVRAKN